MEVLSVLVVDDAVLYSSMVSSWFREDEHLSVVGTAGDMASALEAAATLKPDVVLLDHLLGDHESPEVLPALRRVAPDAVVVLVSGLAEAELAGVARGVGADGWVSKLTSAPQLRTRILLAYEGRTGRVPAPYVPS